VCRAARDEPVLMSPNATSRKQVASEHSWVTQRRRRIGFSASAPRTKSGSAQGCTAARLAGGQLLEGARIPRHLASDAVGGAKSVRSADGVCA